MEMLRLTGVGILTTLLLFAAGCGSSSSSSDNGGGGNPPPTPINDPFIPLDAGAATATASYDSPSAANVIDGDQTAATDWAGNVDGDQITIALDKVYSLSEIILHKNGGAYSNGDFEFFISADGAIWTKVTYVLTSANQCDNFSIVGGTKYTCKFSSRRDVRHIRYVMRDAVATARLYEVEVKGITP